MGHNLLPVNDFFAIKAKIESIRKAKTFREASIPAIRPQP
jgi:hypothetical protein